MKKIKKRAIQKSKEKLRKEDYELDEVDYKIMRYILDYKSLTNIQIGELIGYSEKQISLRRNKPAFKKAIAVYSLKPIEILISLKPEAAIKMGKHIRSKDERVSLKACENVLGDDLKEKIITFVDLSKAIENLDNAIGAAKVNN